MKVVAGIGLASGALSTIHMISFQWLYYHKISQLIYFSDDICAENI